MAVSQNFIFSNDRDSGFLTSDQIKARRRVLDAMMARSAGDMPRNLGEGIASVGQALANRIASNRLDKEEAALRQRQVGIDADLSSALSYDPGGSSSSFGASPSSSSSAGIAPSYKGSAAENDNGLAPYQTALLDTISGPESAGSYNVVYGGGRFNDFTDHPRQDIRIASGPNAGKTSSAAGRYQFLGSTWDQERAELNLPDFSPANQDRAAWNLAAKTYRARTGQDLNTVLQSGDPDAIAGVGQALNGVWTSLPGGIEQGTNVNRFTSAYQGALSRRASVEGAAPGSPQGQPVQVASLDPTIGMTSALAYDPRRPPTVRQSIGNAIAAQGGASIDGTLSPEDQARYNQLTGRQPGQVDPNAVAYTGPAEYNTPELRLDTSGARVTRDSEERAPTVRQAIGNALAAQGGQAPAAAPTQLAALPAPQTVAANPTPSPEAAFSPAVQQAAAADAGFDGFAQTGAQKVARAMYERGIGLPEVPAAPDGSDLPAFVSPDMPAVQRVQHAVSVAQARSGRNPAAFIRVLNSPDATDDQRQTARFLLTKLYGDRERNETRAYNERQAETERQNNWTDYQQKARFDAELKAGNPDTVLDRDYKRAQIAALNGKSGGYRTLSPEEAARRGLPAGSTYQEGPDGKIDPIGNGKGITVNNGGNGNKFDDKSDEKAAERIDTLIQEGNAAPQFLGDMQMLTDLGKTIVTGKGAQLKSALGPYAESLGFDIKGLDEVQAYQGIISRLAPQMRPAGSGATSDFDARQFLSSLPSIGNTPGGNELIQGTFQAIGENKMQAAEIAARTRLSKEDGGLTWYEAERQIRALPNPYERFRAYRSGQGNQPSTASPAPSPVPTSAPAPAGAGLTIMGRPQGGSGLRQGNPNAAPAVPRARNPATGETIEFRNGQWVTVQ